MQHMLRVKFDFRLLLIYPRGLQIQRLGVQIVMSINNKKRIKVRVRLQGEGRLEKREVRGLGTTKDRREMSEQEGRGGW